MNVFRKLFCVTFLVAYTSATPGKTDLLGSVHAGTYGDTTYEEIHGIEVSARRMFSDYTYDITIAGTTLDDPIILCRLYDRDEQVLSQRMKGSNTGETFMYFKTSEADVTARCFHAVVERLTRPSGSP